MPISKSKDWNTILITLTLENICWYHWTVDEWHCNSCAGFQEEDYTTQKQSLGCKSVLCVWVVYKCLEYSEIYPFRISETFVSNTS